MEWFEWVKVALGICGIILAIVAVYFFLQVAMIVRSVRRIVGRLDVLLDFKAWFDLIRSFPRRK